MTLDRNVVTKIIRVMNNPRNIRALSKAYSKSLMHKNIKDAAAKRVVGIKVSQLYRRRKQALLNWVRKFNKTELNRLVANNSNEYNRRINSIPNPPITRTNLIKAVAARYVLNVNAMQWNNAANAVRYVHGLYGRSIPVHIRNNQGQPLQSRIPNGPLVSLLMGLPSEQLKYLNSILPFYA